jgi:hypothetical protein
MNTATYSACGPVDAASDTADICEGQCAELPRAEFRVQRSSVPVMGYRTPRRWVRWFVTLSTVLAIGSCAARLSVVQSLITQQEQTLQQVWQDAKFILAP